MSENRNPRFEALLARYIEGMLSAELQGWEYLGVIGSAGKDYAALKIVFRRPRRRDNGHATSAANG